MASKP